MKFRDEYWFLSNMYPCKLIFKDEVYGSVENAFQAFKCVSKSERLMFKGLTGSDSKKLGRKVKLRSNWNDIRDYIMYKCVSKKFEDEKLRFLLSCIDGEIVEENDWGDTYWGVCNGVGKNKLGKILMRVREEIRE